MRVYVGTAAWNIPKIASEHFPEGGSHLERYSQILRGVEINSCFYKDHMPKSYERWGASTPAHFKFSLKLHQRFTHEKEALINEGDLLEVLKGMSELGEKWDVLLLQFPASLQFHPGRMERLYKIIRKVYRGHLVVEPRNQGWLQKSALELMAQYQVSKVLADPERCVVQDEKGLDFGGISYYRLHGSPEIYKSNYDEKFLNTLPLKFRDDQKVWCIFDNTTFGYATQNAVELQRILQKGPRAWPETFHTDLSW